MNNINTDIAGPTCSSSRTTSHDCNLRNEPIQKGLYGLNALVCDTCQTVRLTADIDNNKTDILEVRRIIDVIRDGLHPTTSMVSIPARA